MARVEYAFIHLNDGLYDLEMREKLGVFFDIAVDRCGLRGQEAAELFVASGLAEQFERQNPGFVAGKSGAELVLWAFEQCCQDCTLEDGTYTPISPDYWVGYMLALFQISTGWPYARVFERMSYADLREMYHWCMDKSEEEVVEQILAELRKRPAGRRLRKVRKAAGLTQKQLAERTGVSMRSIQQYEEGKKDINKAAVGSVHKMSLVLGCCMEDLLEPAV